MDLVTNVLYDGQQGLMEPFLKYRWLLYFLKYRWLLYFYRGEKSGGGTILLDKGLFTKTNQRLQKDAP